MTNSCSAAAKLTSLLAAAGLLPNPNMKKYFIMVLSADFIAAGCNPSPHTLVCLPDGSLVYAAGCNIAITDAVS